MSEGVRKISVLDGFNFNFAFSLSTRRSPTRAPKRALQFQAGDDLLARPDHFARQQLLELGRRGPPLS